MTTLNLGILAHIDAGKTSLTERLLHAAGAIDVPGSVDAGDTQTDSLDEERRRGITIKSAVASFTLGDTTVNLIDTPGHPDFIAEVERVLNVLDGAVLVVSAVEGVQAQTRVLMRTLRRLRIPTLIFVNKVDRSGARDTELLRELTGKLVPAIAPLTRVHRLGTRHAGVEPAADVAGLTETLAEYDDAILSDYVDNKVPPYHRLYASLAERTAQVHPVLFGSAVTGAGLDTLITGIVELLPPADTDATAPVSGRVFKVERGPAGEKIAYVRVHRGTIRVRQPLRYAESKRDKVTGVRMFDAGQARRATEVTAGRIAQLWGLRDVRIGDWIGEPHRTTEHHFAPPTLETLVLPADPRQGGAMYSALSQLAEQDPLIDLRHDAVRGETFVSLYGEVQKEVIQAALADEFGVEVSFGESGTICVERPVATGEAVEVMGADGNPFRAGVGLRLEPGPVGSGVRFALGVEPGSLPVPFTKSIEETVRRTLREGLHGWEVVDCVVTLTDSGYTPPPPGGWSSISSAASDFRSLTPLVVADALRRAGTRVLEPIHAFRLEIPGDTLGMVLPALARVRAVPLDQRVAGAEYVVSGDIPAEAVRRLRRRLPALTRGEGVLESVFDRHEPVDGAPPSRPRTDWNPLCRKDYLLRAVRHV